MGNFLGHFPSWSPQKLVSWDRSLLLPGSSTSSPASRFLKQRVRGSSRAGLGGAGAAPKAPLAAQRGNGAAVFTPACGAGPQTENKNNKSNNKTVITTTTTMMMMMMI